MAARASSGAWRCSIEASIVWSIAARQLMVQANSTALKFTSAPNATFNI